MDDVKTQPVAHVWVNQARRGLFDSAVFVDNREEPVFRSDQSRDRKEVEEHAQAWCERNGYAAVHEPFGADQAVWNNLRDLLADDGVRLPDNSPRWMLIHEIAGLRAYRRNERAQYHAVVEQMGFGPTTPFEEVRDAVMHTMRGESAFRVMVQSSLNAAGLTNRLTEQQIRDGLAELVALATGRKNDRALEVAQKKFETIRAGVVDILRRYGADLTGHEDEGPLLTMLRGHLGRLGACQPGDLVIRRGVTLQLNPHPPGKVYRVATVVNDVNGGPPQALWRETQKDLSAAWPPTPITLADLLLWVETECMKVDPKGHEEVVNARRRSLEDDIRAKNAAAADGRVGVCLGCGVVRPPTHDGGPVECGRCGGNAIDVDRAYHRDQLLSLVNWRKQRELDDDKFAEAADVLDKERVLEALDHAQNLVNGSEKTGPMPVPVVRALLYLIRAVVTA